MRAVSCSTGRNRGTGSVGADVQNLHRWARFAGGDQGVARLMSEARQQHPEWADTLAPWLGAAMRRDGFFTRSLHGFDAAMILAGLEYEPSEQESVFEPLMDPKIVEALRRRMSDGSLPRADLIALTLRKLQGPLRPSIAKCWIEWFKQLALTDAEIRDRAGEFITLLNAPAQAASKLAFAIVEEHFLEDAERTAERVGALGYGLQNPVQVLTKAALRLLRKQVKSHPERTASALNAVVNGLGSPHAALRADLLRWLGTFQPQQFDETTLTQLQSVAGALPPAELAPIAHLLAERPAAPTDLGGEADRDPRSELLAQVEVIRRRAEADAADSLLQRRLAFLEGYLATGQCSEFAATVPDHSSAWSPPAFALHETAEALALDIARTQRRVFAQADYERIFAGILRFPRRLIPSGLEPSSPRYWRSWKSGNRGRRMEPGGGVGARNCRRYFWREPGSARRCRIFPRIAWAGSCSIFSSNRRCGDG